MAAETARVRKVTISLPVDLVDFADHKAARLNISRSRLIAVVLSENRAAEEERLAVEGYRFYAQEANEFAETSVGAVAEAMGHAG